MIDSDRKGPNDTLNDTKTRILDEVKEIGATGWVTDGYTLENYARPAVLQTVIEAEYPKNAYEVPADRHTSPLAAKFTGLTTKPSKITVARRMTEQSQETWYDDLWPHIDELAIAVRAANDL